MTNLDVGASEIAAQVKHRACDECRTRKLACTKEPDGCSRCKREGIQCNYSPQKQMGRPRKRPRDDPAENQTTTDSGPMVTEPSDELRRSKNVMTDLPPDTQDPGMAFLNLLSGGDLNVDGQDPFAAGDNNQDQRATWDLFGNYSTGAGEVNYNPPAAEVAPTFSSTNIDPNLFIAATAEAASYEPVPGLSPNASTPDSSQSASAPPPSGEALSCACTATLYLSLSAMQTLPQIMEDAVRAARHATKTAYEVVNCPVCAFKIGPPHGMLNGAVISNFQNLMLLATLIPSTVHAYERILAMVDQEARQATAERRQLIFKLNHVGGLWGALDQVQCGGGGEFFSHREMEPTLWRLTMRALLKSDVYGVSGSHGCNPLHLGLKDIVNLMESKSKARHAFMDAMVESGTWKHMECHSLQLHKNGETPTCQRIIAIAKTSVENLVIP